MTWQFCNEFQLVLTDALPQLLLKRKYNQFLMQAFLDHSYSDKELKLLNLCRLWSHITTLSDITTGDGRHLQQKFWDQQGKITRNKNKWPPQGTPDNHYWKAWQDAL
jgi:hypothetical protein